MSLQANTCVNASEVLPGSIPAPGERGPPPHHGVAFLY